MPRRAVKRSPRGCDFRGAADGCALAAGFTVDTPLCIADHMHVPARGMDGAAADGGASVAFRAHIGGFLTGMLLVPFLKRRDVRLW